MKALLEESLNSFYWIGFILADGSFDKNGRLSVGLAKCDLNHLKILSNILESNIISNKLSYSTSKQINSIGKKIQEKFDIRQNKTLNPPDINRYNFSLDQSLSLVIGFIDGDGCILRQSKGRRDSFLRIKNHSSWLLFHNWCRIIIAMFSKKTFPEAKINRYGYSELIIAQNKIIVLLKSFSEENKLPILKRKWLKVVDYENRNERHVKNRISILRLHEEGLKGCDIAKMLGVSQATVSMTIRGLR